MQKGLKTLTHNQMGSKDQSSNLLQVPHTTWSLCIKLSLKDVPIRQPEEGGVRGTT